MTSLKRQRCEIMEDRKKKPRFSEKEIELLVQGVKERSDIINSKFSDVINNSKKKQAWFEVMEAVNAVSFSTRTVDELYKKEMGRCEEGDQEEGICRTQRAV